MGESFAIRKSIPVALMSEAGKRKLFGNRRRMRKCLRLSKIDGERV